MVFGTFLTWDASSTTAMLGYVADLILDLTPLLIPIIAVSLGLLIFTVIAGILRK